MENSNRRSGGASGSSDRPRRNSGSSKNSNRNSSRPNSRPDSRNSNPNRSERSDRPRSERPARDGEFKARRPRIEGKDGEFKPRRPRPESKDGEKRSFSRSNNAAFKPRGERRGDRSLDNRRKDDRRPINRDFSKDPIIPEGITGEELDKVTRGDLLTLSAENAKIVSQHLACVNAYADSEPELAHEHAQAAVRHAGRVAVVRETAGYAAYRVGKYEIAIKDLKAAFRINGDVSIWPVLADCERGLGKPRKALELAGAPEAKKLQKEQAIELRIVAAGARRDLGEFEAAVVTLQTNDLNTENDSWAVRLRYAYADALDAAGRKDEARKWFAKCAAIDVDEVTDAVERS
jgi:tetratricopeptide (TPR) repeat protein